MWNLKYDTNEPICENRNRVFPGGSDGKESTCNAGDLGLIPGSGRSPGEGNGNPLQYSCPGKSHGWRSLAGYGSWGHKELDTTEQLTEQACMQGKIHISLCI